MTNDREWMREYMRHYDNKWAREHKKEINEYHNRINKARYHDKTLLEAILGKFNYGTENNLNQSAANCEEDSSEYTSSSENIN